ncbi:MAG: VOC family protein [SAR202 cluster bacterium]|nr:VOC family protein [SAR202 cluster bacterium]
MVQKLHHTGFVVKNVEESTAFYRDVVGLSLIRAYERMGTGIDQVVGYENAHLSAAILDIGGGHILELIQYVNPRSEDRPTEERNVLGATHLALLVDDIHAMYARLAEKGGQVMNPPAELEPGRIACYLQDPDGNWIELLELS